MTYIYNFCTVKTHCINSATNTTWSRPFIAAWMISLLLFLIFFGVQQYHDTEHYMCTQNAWLYFCHEMYKSSTKETFTKRLLWISVTNCNTLYA